MATWRTICLPREHGVWGLLAGAALVGLPLGDDLAGLPLLGAAVALVFARQAWSVVGDRRSRHVALTMGLLALGCVMLVQRLSASSGWMIWLVIAAGLAAGGQLTQRGRPWWSSGLSASAFAALGGAVAAAGMAPPTWTAIGSAVLAAHFLAAVPLVRAQTRPDPLWPRLALTVHAGCALVAGVCWASALIPSGIPLLFAFSLARAWLIVDKRTTMYASSSRRNPAAIGMAEMAWLPVVATAVVLSLRGGAW
jgi:hypothetical protein